MNRKMANKTERLNFEEIIQRDKKNMKTDRITNEHKTPQTFLPSKNNTQIKNNPYKATKRDLIWEEKRNKKLNGIDSKIKIATSAVINYMNNLIVQSSNYKIYNTGTPQSFENVRTNINMAPQCAIHQKNITARTPFPNFNKFAQNTQINDKHSSYNLPNTNLQIVQNNNNQTRVNSITPYDNPKTIIPQNLNNQYYDNSNIKNNKFFQTAYSNSVIPMSRGQVIQRPFQAISFRNQTPSVGYSRQGVF
jgi:hypothetical protein